MDLGPRRAGAATALDARQPAEWLPARLALLCEPQIETRLAVLEMEAGLLRPLSAAEAVAEHRAFRRRLEAGGTRVVDVREALIRVDPEILREAAGRALVVRVHPGVGEAESSSLARRHEESISALDAPGLVDLITLRPVVHIRPNKRGFDPTGTFRATFEIDLAHNAYYTRDPIITTAVGAVIGRPREEVRRPESAIAELVLGHLGIAPILRVAPPGFIEGGDFLPAGRFALQGQGLLSDPDGIGQLLDAGAYGDVEVAVVRDSRAQADEIHLDTYFALFGPEIAGIRRDRFGEPQPEVDVYVPEPTMAGRRYRRAKTLRLLDYLRSKGVRVIPFTEEEGDALAAGGLLVGPMHYLVPSSAGDGFLSRLRDEGVIVETMSFSSLQGGRAGAHCSTQVLVRSER